MSQNKITNWLLGISLAILLFGSGFKLGEYKTAAGKVQRSSYNVLNFNKDKNAAKNIDFALFWEVWDKVEQKFIDKKKLDPKKMYYGALKGLVASLEDPYTFFLTPEENKQSKDDLGGKFEGIGAQLGLKNSRILIVAPLKDSPAERAGVQAGDYILKVDGADAKNWTLPQAVSKIRGTKGTKVKLTLLREGTKKEFDVTITRDQINIASVELSYEKQGSTTAGGQQSQQPCTLNCPEYAYLKLNQFGENTNEEWDKAVAEIAQRWQSRSIKGLILDLRDNPGGFLDSSVYLASEFLPLDKLVVKQESTVGQNKTYVVTRDGALLDIPLVVLINQGSASASEILAGALRDYDRAELVGVKSFGKGSVQEALDLKQGAGLHVTVARWILPKGDWINGKGIEPDIVVENKTQEGNTPTRTDDAQLDRAIQELIK